jgi:hypothetical protein
MLGPRDLDVCERMRAVLLAGAKALRSCAIVHTHCSSAHSERGGTSQRFHRRKTRSPRLKNGRPRTTGELTASFTPCDVAKVIFPYPGPAGA